MMNVGIVGAGPGGLFSAILLKKRDRNNQVTVFEKDAYGESFGFGVVFSDQSLRNIQAVDSETYSRIEKKFVHWKGLTINVGDISYQSHSHGFNAIERQCLLGILHERCEELGVITNYNYLIDPSFAVDSYDLVIAADGIDSQVRKRFQANFRPSITFGGNYYIWLSTTYLFGQFIFIFIENQDGLWYVHAYPYDKSRSTLIVETDEITWKRAGMHRSSEQEAKEYIHKLLKKRLKNSKIISNHSVWRQFLTIKNKHWCFGNVVILGDAAHTAHFSIGSGTKLAMEDAIVLANSIKTKETIKQDIKRYESCRRPSVERMQKAAIHSQTWFENVVNYYRHLDKTTFFLSLLTRSSRIICDSFKNDGVISYENTIHLSDSNLPISNLSYLTPYRFKKIQSNNRYAIFLSRASLKHGYKETLLAPSMLFYPILSKDDLEKYVFNKYNKEFFLTSTYQSSLHILIINFHILKFFNLDSLLIKLNNSFSSQFHGICFNVDYSALQSSNDQTWKQYLKLTKTFIKALPDAFFSCKFSKFTANNPINNSSSIYGKINMLIDAGIELFIVEDQAINQDLEEIDAYKLRTCENIRMKYKVATLLMGCVPDFKKINTLLLSGRADFVGTYVEL